MSTIYLRIKPEMTGKHNSLTPLTDALLRFGYGKVTVTQREWTGKLWGIIPVGGHIPWDTRVTCQKCSTEHQTDIVVVGVESQLFYRKKF